jgi:hypothetical protein
VSDLTRATWDNAEQWVPGTRLNAFQEINRERIRQDGLWGEQNHSDGTGERFRADADMYRADCDAAARAGSLHWFDILLEEVYEAAAESDPKKLRVELVQSAAVIMAWIEAIDRRADA